MAFGLDYVTGPPIDALKNAGVTFVCRYLSFVNNLTKVKLLSANEAKTLSQAGISIVSNYEWYANRATEGHASGVQDAQIARDQHAACGGPPDRPIYFSVDADVAGEQTADYFRGVISVIGLSRTGAYGSYRVLKYLFDNQLIVWGWQTYAWSYGAWEPRAHIQQYNNGVMLVGMSVDYDRSIKPDFGQWRQGESMQIYTEQSTGFSTWFLAKSASVWECKQTGKTIQFGLKSLYQKLSIDGQSLPVVGLPLTGELRITIKDKTGKDVTIVVQICERGVLIYDPAHALDSQPGMGDAYLAHLDNVDLLKLIPGLTLPTQSAPAIDTTAAEAAINDIINGMAPLAARAIVEVKKLGQ